MFEHDYPAAHSMDTTWYAIDAHGYIGQFETGENGHAPERTNLAFSIYDLQHRLEKVGENDWEPTDALAERFGIFHYEYLDGYDPILPYGRAYPPTTPLHIDMLPPELRKAWKVIQFPSIVFAATPYVQPLDFMPCLYWYDERKAFIASDNKTVRPLWGHEAEFAAFLAEWRDNDPDALAKLHIDPQAPRYDPGDKP